MYGLNEYDDMSCGRYRSEEPGNDLLDREARITCERIQEMYKNVLRICDEEKAGRGFDGERSER